MDYRVPIYTDDNEFSLLDALYTRFRPMTKALVTVINIKRTIDSIPDSGEYNKAVEMFLQSPLEYLVADNGYEPDDNELMLYNYNKLFSLLEHPPYDWYISQFMYYATLDVNSMRLLWKWGSGAGGREINFGPSTEESRLQKYRSQCTCM